MEPWLRECGKNKAVTQLGPPMPWIIVMVLCLLYHPCAFPTMKFPGKSPSYHHQAKWFGKGKGWGGGFWCSKSQGIPPCCQYGDSDWNQDRVNREG